MTNASVSPPDSTTQPVLFIPHGAGPCFFMDWNPPGTWEGMAGFLKGVAASLPARPRAILMVSAHWRTPGFRVSAGEYPELIYDFAKKTEMTVTAGANDPVTLSLDGTLKGVEELINCQAAQG